MWFLFLAIPAILMAALALRGERRRAEYVTARLPCLHGAPLPPVALIALEPLNFADQDYPSYHIIAASDAASALQWAKPETEVYALALSRGTVSPQWLRALVSGLAEPGAGASTGFRWYLPDPPSFRTLVESVWNAVIAGRLGPGDNEFAWSGACAVSKETFEKARVLDYWQRLPDPGLALAAAMREAGLGVAFAPGAMVVPPSTGRFASPKDMALLRECLPNLWWRALAAHALYCAAMAATLAAIFAGSGAAEWAFITQLGLGMLKGANRSTLAKAEFPEYKSWFDRYSWVHIFWVPLTTWVWLYALLASAFTRVRLRYNGR